MSEQSRKILYNVDQPLTEAEQVQACKNAGAVHNVKFNDGDTVTALAKDSDQSVTVGVTGSGNCVSDVYIDHVDHYLHIDKSANMQPILTAGAGIDIDSNNVISCTSSDVNMVQDTPAGSVVTKIDTLNIHQDTHEVYGDVDGATAYLGFVAPYVNAPVSSDKMLMIADGSTTPAWRDAPEYYVARIEGSSPNFTCNYAQLDYAYSQGKICFIANEGSGALAGWLKYKDSNGFLFECFHAQIMHAVEMRVSSDDRVTTINRSMYASRVVETYQCTRTGQEDFQNPAATMTWVGPSYLTSSSTAQWYRDVNYSTPTGYINVLTSLRNTSQYEKIRFSSSGSICHYRDSALAGTPNSIYRITVVAYAMRIFDSQYVTFNLPDAPVVQVNCDNYTQAGSTWGSDWVNYAIDYTTDTNTLYNAGLSSQYENWRLVVQYELINEAQSTSYHWLGIRNETQRITLTAHL